MLLANGREFNEEELVWLVSKAGGPGGQHVNKTSTAVQLRWNLEYSSQFRVDEKQWLRKKLAHRLTLDGEILVDESSHRSQLKNRQGALSKFNTLLSEALKRPKKRKATKPTRSSKERRLKHKKQAGEKKRRRSERF